MALFKPILGELKGSIGGNTFQGNRFGQLVRNRTKPVDPNTPAQATRRAQLSTANTQWTTGLTSAQRGDWDNYAANTPWTNKFGDTVFLTGRQMFIRTSVFFQAAGSLTLPLAPITGGLPSNPDFTLTADTTTGLNISDLLKSASGTDAVGIYTSSPKAQTINFFKGPFVASRFEPSNVTVPLLLKSSTLLNIGERYFVGVRYLADDLSLANQVLIKSVDVLT